jgi:hypothetical protein
MVKSCLLFTDIKQSSNLWKTYGKKMNKALDKHNDQVNKLCKIYKGLIVKMIGDAYMISFTNIKNAVDFAYNICLLQKKEPVIVGNDDKIKIRIGICYGDVSIKKIKIQNKQLIDYFGPAVNMASRMESKVSDPEGFAISLHGEKKINSDIIKLLKNYPKLKYSLHSYSYSKCKDIKRSERLLSSEQIKCFNADDLKGVGEVLAYKCDLTI